MFQIRAYGYNKEYFCVSILPTMEDCQNMIGETLWDIRTFNKNGNLVINYSDLDEDTYQSMINETKIPCFGECYDDMILEILPFNFGDIVSHITH